MAGRSRDGRSRSAALCVALTLACAASVLPAEPAAAANSCPAGQFCAYDDAGYRRVLLVSSAARGTEKVDVPDDRVSSVVNNTGNTWSGVTKNRFLFDQVIVTVPPHSTLSYVGAQANDRIDHFDVY